MNFKVNTTFLMLESSKAMLLKYNIGTVSPNSCKPQRPNILMYDSISNVLKKSSLMDAIHYLSDTL